MISSGRRYPGTRFSFIFFLADLVTVQHHEVPLDRAKSHQPQLVDGECETDQQQDLDGVEKVKAGSQARQLAIFRSIFLSRVLPPPSSSSLENDFYRRRPSIGDGEGGGGEEDGEREGESVGRKRFQLSASAPIRDERGKGEGRGKGKALYSARDRERVSVRSLLPLSSEAVGPSLRLPWGMPQVVPPH